MRRQLFMYYSQPPCTITVAGRWQTWHAAVQSAASQRLDSEVHNTHKRTSSQRVKKTHTNLVRAFRGVCGPCDTREQSQRHLCHVDVFGIPRSGLRPPSSTANQYNRYAPYNVISAYKCTSRAVLLLCNPFRYILSSICAHCIVAGGGRPVCVRARGGCKFIHTYIQNRLHHRCLRLLMPASSGGHPTAPTHPVVGGIY